MKTARVALLLLVAIYFSVNLYAYTTQRQLMYFPSLERVTPKDVGLTNVEEVTLQTDSNAKLTCWYGRATIGQPTVLFFHGNGGAVSHRAQRIRDLMSDGYGIFILGYPGYGGNDGAPSEASFMEGALLSYEYLQNSGVASSDIVLYGESLGSGVAVQLAASVEARSLILESPMSSAIEVAREHYPLLLASFLLKDTFQSIDYVDRIDMPLLVMHGDRDRVIPIRIGQQLFEKARDPKKFITLKGAGHNNLQLYPVGEIVREFLDAL